MCYFLYYSLGDKLSKYVFIYTESYIEQKLCIWKCIYPIEYSRIPHIQTEMDPIFLINKPISILK